MDRNSVKKYLLGLLAAAGLIGGPAQAQTAYPLFAPANGILVGNENTFITTAAAWSDVAALLSGSCTTSAWLRGDGTCVARGDLTRVNDTNVTLTLGGTPTAALLNSTSMTMGWSGTLAAARGGTGLATVTDDTTLVANGTTWVSTAIPNCTDTTGQHLNYLTASNSFTCGTTGPGGITGLANPTGTIGLTAVNGVATTAIRSDGAPALSQAIAPTWTQQHLFTSIATDGALQARGTVGIVGYNETDAAADNRLWRTYADSSLWRITTLNDALSVARTALSVSRSGVAVATVDFGNTTDNPSYSFTGTGAATFNGLGSSSADSIRISSNLPMLRFTDADAGTDLGQWQHFVSGSTITLRTTNDANSVANNAMVVTRNTTGPTVLDLGNTSTNPTTNFLGTGVVTLNGPFTSTGAIAQRGIINSTDASGPYVTWQRSGTSFGDIGNGRQIGGSFTVDSMALGARSGFNVEMAAGGRTTPDFQITNAGAINFPTSALVTFSGPITSTQAGSSVNTSAFTVNSTTPLIYLRDSNSGTDLKVARVYSDGSAFHLDWQDDAGATTREFLNVGFGGAAGPSSMAFGNATNNTTYSFLGTGAVTSGGVFRGPDGAVGTPTYSFSNDTNTGMYNGGVADQIGFSTNGSQRLLVSTTAFTGSLPWQGQSGSVGTPAMGFSADTNTGFYSIGSDNVGASMGNSLVFDWLVSGSGGARVADYGGTLQVVGFREIPQNSQSVNYGLVLADSGKHILHPNGGGAGDTYTIPANATIAYPIGTVITIVNRDSNNISVAITTDTLILGGTTTTGTRTIGQNGVATILKVESTTWIITGTGVT